MPVWFEG